MAETKTCENCRNQFTIEPDDFDFYAKIKVPAPTWCPECRTIRRFSWRNERIFHKNICARTGKSLISGFSPDSGIKVYDRDVWWSDGWDALAYGSDYDFSKNFFNQFRALLEHVPQPNVFNARTVNCDYTQHTGDYKNAYLVFASWSGENMTYGARCLESKDSMDVFAMANCELCYQVMEANKCYKIAFSQRVENCSDSFFLFDCKGCANCFGCVNLRNKSYCIFNKPYGKENYHKKINELNLGSNVAIAELKRRFVEIKLQCLHKYANINNSQKSTGNNITNAYNCRECFDVSTSVRDCKFVQNALTLKDSYDCYGAGANAELLYEIFDCGVQGSRQLFGGVIYGCLNTQYSYNCHNCENCFGCVGLRKKQYCVLNKQYSKEEYEELVPRIIAHMNEQPYVDGKGRVYRYGEFFPPELSPFAYNETIAQEYFPLTKDQALAQGYRWRDPETRNYQITISNSQLPDHIKDVSDSITEEIIQCEHTPLSSPENQQSRKPVFPSCNEQCTQAFKIIPQELQFYRRMNLPLPRLCPNCRHYERLKQRNPLKLWERQCACQGVQSSEFGVQRHSDSQPITPNSELVSSNPQLLTSSYLNTASHFHGTTPCPNAFQTSYAPDRPEIVYCEQCYNAEVV